MIRIDEYRVMWILALFDLPTETKKDIRAYQKFRKDLLGDGFTMFQFSAYLRHCPSAENAEVHRQRIRKSLPEYGKVGILTLTDKQFSEMEIYFGRKPERPALGGQQLELF